VAGHSAPPVLRFSDIDFALAVARAQSGHVASLDRVLRAVQGPLQRHVRALVSDADLGDDVLQDVLWTIARRVSQLRDARWFRPRAYRIATRAALRRTHSERRWRDALRDEELSLLEAPIEESSFDPETLQAIVEQIDSLSPASSIVVRLHYVEEMTFQEIAEALEISVGTVKSRAAYGLSTLRRRLNV
jgi:RNA polymerase sigma-70 factor (ECF subfamily)